MSDKDITPQQYQAIALIATGSNIKTTADKIGVSDRTVLNWLKSQLFKSELNEVVAIAYRSYLSRFQKLLDLGLDRIDDVLRSPDTSPADTIRAVKLLLDASDRLSQISALEELANIKAMLEDKML